MPQGCSTGIAVCAAASGKPMWELIQLQKSFLLGLFLLLRLMHQRSEQLEEWDCQVVTAAEVLVRPACGCLCTSLSIHLAKHTREGSS